MLGIAHSKHFYITITITNHQSASLNFAMKEASGATKKYENRKKDQNS